MTRALILAANARSATPESADKRHTRERMSIQVRRYRHDPRCGRLDLKETQNAVARGDINAVFADGDYRSGGRPG